MGRLSGPASPILILMDVALDFVPVEFNSIQFILGENSLLFF